LLLKYLNVTVCQNVRLSVNENEIGTHGPVRILNKDQTGFKHREALRIVAARAGADIYRKGEEYVTNSLAECLTVINQIVK
jgi:hypothetical protein